MTLDIAERLRSLADLVPVLGAADAFESGLLMRIAQRAAALLAEAQ